jgi:dCMP deaminase
MSKWDDRMSNLANLVSTWSKDPSTGVGAVIVDAKNRVVSLGFNGFPMGVVDSDEMLFERDEKLRRTIHAEENALLFSSRSVEGCTMYVTHLPCARCAAKIIQSGIARVVAQIPDEMFCGRWEADMRSASAMFAEAGVVFMLTDREPARATDGHKTFRPVAMAKVQTIGGNAGIAWHAVSLDPTVSPPLLPDGTILYAED